MKNKIIMIIIISFIFSSLSQTNTVHASTIKTVSPNEKNTYYVSNEKENTLVMNLIKFNMETDVNIIYSKKMIPKSKDDLNNYYIIKTFNSGSFYSSNLFHYANNVGVYDRFSIKSLKYNKKNNTVKINYVFSYFDTTDESECIGKTINKEIKDNISQLKTDYEKAKWAYDWVLNNSSYDFNIQNFSIYGGITGSGMVCSGYAILYCSIATKLGLDCRLVEGSVNNVKFRNHVWNLIKINGKFYCVDPTWGDYYGKDDYFLKASKTLSLQEYGHHVSKAYDKYIEDGEIFADDDYVENGNSSIHYLLPSVYDIEMSLLKNNTLSVDEDYSFIKNNLDNIPIYFLSVNDNIATVNSDGIITGVNKGTTIIIASNYILGFEQRLVINVK